MQGMRRTALVVFAVALVLRAGWGVYRMNTVGAVALEFPDEQQYWLMATSLHDGAGLVDELGFRAGRMPLYPALLSLAAGAPSGVAVVKIAQWFLGAIGAVFALVLGTRVAGRTVGTLVGLMFAVDPFLVFFSSLLLTETLFVTLLVGLWAYGAGLIVAWRNPPLWQWFVIGVLSLACVYARESTLGLIGVALLVQLVWRRFRGSAWGGIVVVCVVIAGLFPWALRNREVVGEMYWLTTRAGISLYDGVGPQATGASDLGDVKNSAAVRGLSEARYNRHFLRTSLAEMRARPGRVVKLALVKFLRMWNPVPNAAEYRSAVVRLVSVVWMAPLLLLALVGVFVLRRSIPINTSAVVIYLLLPAIYLSALHMVFIGSVRYRLGAMPTLFVLAAVGLEHLRLAARAHGSGDT